MGSLPIPIRRALCHSRRVARQATRTAFVALAALFTGDALAGRATSIPPANQPVTGPQSVLEDWAQAYRDKSPEGVGAALTADYVFHTQTPDPRGFITGIDRESEMHTTRGMLEGVKRDGVQVMPPADSVFLFVDGVNQSTDPEHPDSTQHYRTLVISRLELRIVFGGDKEYKVANSRHVVHVVRGDAAVLAEGQPADPDRWYIRRWLNDISGVASKLREGKGGCGEDEPAGEPASGAPRSSPRPGPTALAIRPLTNPACAKLAVTCDLPGVDPAWVEVYDVSGRRLNRRDVPVAAAGSVTVEAGRGATLLPGIYWVRVGQKGSRPETRMVAVAK